MKEAYFKGIEVKTLGKSIEYNPYRYKGTAQEYLDFVKGYNAQSVSELTEDPLALY
jgi:hypothetical protein